jgi:endoglucanase
MSIERAAHHRWLLELTQIPTAAGRESRVVAWIRQWASERPGVNLTEDAAGNLHLRMRRAKARTRGGPIYFTAHLDHPAFVVERIVGPGTLQLVFRGGVMDDYFKDAGVVVHDAGGGRHKATLAGKADGVGPFPSYLAEMQGEAESDQVTIGDVATWDLPDAEIRDGLLHTNACDDLAAAAAALAAFDVLLHERGAGPDVRLLFTRAEEIGFVGAIAACRAGTMPRNARVIALENSRSFDDSPIGGGPIVRVGDRMSIFSPGLTGAIAKMAEQISGGPAIPIASQKQAERPWKWQRKLMAGGACEATVFCAMGYDATCLCLPLGNYHNMADLAAVQAGANTSPARPGREFISIADFDGLVDLLVACGRGLPAADSVRQRIDKLWAERQFVLREERPVKKPRMRRAKTAARRRPKPGVPTATRRSARARQRA